MCLSERVAKIFGILGAPINVGFEGADSCALVNGEDVDGLDWELVVVEELLRDCGAGAEVDNLDLSSNAVQGQVVHSVVFDPHKAEGVVRGEEHVGERRVCCYKMLVKENDIGSVVRRTASVRVFLDFALRVRNYSQHTQNRRN